MTRYHIKNINTDLSWCNKRKAWRVTGTHYNRPGYARYVLLKLAKEDRKFAEIMAFSYPVKYNGE